LRAGACIERQAIPDVLVHAREERHVTTVAGHVTIGPTAAAQPPAGAAGSAELPRLAEGVELLGEYQDSGYSQPPCLVRRADGQVIQMSALLYSVTSRIDGSRGPAALADLVSADLGRSITADQVRYLVTAKLLPLGIVATDDAPASPPKARPLLALRARGTLLPEPAANAAGALLRPLFRWPVVAAVVASILALDYWLFAVHGLGGGLQQVLRDPVDLLLVLGLSVVSAVFHECGHATGCRYGGARPGVIGVGIYLVWPSFFTNVTDSYRLSRAGRLRTDLGGLYFNAIFMLALAGIYAGTSAEVLLVVIAVTHLEMLEQLLPFVRFDGYFILSDLIGVPDLFARVVPILKSALPAGRRDPRVTGLRRRVRIVVTGWVVCVMPLLAAGIGFLLLRLPQVDRALWRSASLQAHLTATAAAGHHYAMAAVNAVGAALIAMSLAGSLYIVSGLARRSAIAGRRWSAGRPARRLLAAVAGLAVLAALAVFWIRQGQFHDW
jgi:putative peptide zinc metalloprotease protein